MGAIVGAFAGALWTVASYGLPLIGVPSRVEALENNQKEVQQPLLYMTCISFAEKHPAQVPAICDRATTKAPR